MYSTTQKGARIPYHALASPLSAFLFPFIPLHSVLYFKLLASLKAPPHALYRVHAEPPYFLSLFLPLTSTLLIARRDYHCRPRLSSAWRADGSAKATASKEGVPIQRKLTRFHQGMVLAGYVRGTDVASSSSGLVVNVVSAGMSRGLRNTGGCVYESSSLLGVAVGVHLDVGDYVESQILGDLQCQSSVCQSQRRISRPGQ